jgi:hypothetical protein
MVTNSGAFPVIVAAASSARNAQQTGIASGDTGTSEPTKRVWLDAQQRMENDTYNTRERACKLEPLVQHILDIQKYGIVGGYTLICKEEARQEETEEWIDSTVKMLFAFRRAFEVVRKHGVSHIQKLYDDKVQLANEQHGIQHLQILKDVQRHEDPFRETNYYYFQKLNVSKNWQAPEETGTEEKRVWYLKDGKSNAEGFNTGSDLVVDRDTVVELRNNESGQSSIGLCLNAIYIKNQLMMGMPMLVKITVTPGEIYEYALCLVDPVTKEVIWSAPTPPALSLNESDSAAYASQKADFDAFTADIQAQINIAAKMRLAQGAIAMPETIKHKIVESGNALNPAMLDIMFTLLNKTIAWALGFPISLIDASGVELATSRVIMDTIAPYLRGLQAQFCDLGVALIKEQFPGMEFTFTLRELHPKDAKEVAEVLKTNMESLEKARNIGYSDNDIRETARALNVTETDLELGGMGALKPEAISAAIAEGGVFIDE